MAVKKTQMYRKNLDTSETNLYPLTEAQYVSMENGQTVQEILSDRDSDKYTPVITNSSSTFKVGQGDNVDLSSSMKEGAYDSCVLKGKTMVNCIQEPSSQDVVLPYEFEEGRYVTINDTKESGALGVELKGQTLVNMAKNKLCDKSNAVGEVNISAKPNTTYIAFFDGTYDKEATAVNFAMFCTSPVYVENTTGLNGDGLYTATVNGHGGNEHRWNPSLNYTKFATSSNQNYIHIRTGGGKTNIKYDNMRIFEYQDGMENWDIPYFIGMASCKMPTLHTVGKNLFDLSNASNGYLSTNAPYVLQSPDYNNKTSAYIKVKPNTKYSYSFDGFTPSQVGNMYWTGFYYYKRIGEVSTVHPSRMTFTSNSEANKQLTFTTPSDCNYIRIGSRGLMLSGATVQLEEATSATAYEPYKSSILSLPEEVVLRSLPNGVCDTFNTRTGVYTQRIGETVLNGSEDDWVSIHAFSKTNVFRKPLPLAKNDVTDYETVVKNFMTDKLPVVKYRTYDAVNAQTVSFSSLFNSTYNDTAIYINKNSSSNLSEFKTWLSQNPVTVQYELKTPIVTKINLSSTLKSWNTTTHVYSEIPENTLYPTLSHSNPSYPVILKPSTKYSIVANSYSNSHTNSTINFNLGGATASTVVGNRVTTVTTPSTLSNELLTMSGRGNKLNNVMVIEGDVMGDEPYFEGICDCKSPILRNTGLTLYESPFEKVYGEGATREFFNMMDLAPYVDKWGVNKNYTFSFDIKANKSGTAQIYFQNGTGSRHNFVFRVPVTTEYVRHTVTTNISGTDHNWKESRFACFTTYDTGCFATIKNIQFALGTSVEPYKSNATTFDQKDDKTIVLRSLPSGVCDTLNVETGEYVQRIGEVTLTPEIINSANYGDDGNSKYLYFSNTNVIFPNRKEGQIVCDKIPYVNTYGSFAPTFSIAQNGGVVIFVFTSDFNTSNNFTAKLNFVKEFVSKNGNITIQYPLATPIVSTIDVQGFPYAYTNGHVQLSSGSIEQSLTPKVEYSLSANKTGQINSNTKRVSAHQKQLDDFEAMMLTQMVQSAYDKAILQFDYEMQMMSLGGE